MKLYFIRHAEVIKQPEVPSDRWVLSEDGIRAAWSVGETLQGVAARWKVSPEPKAVRTFAEAMRGTAFECDERLRELRRGGWVNDYRAAGQRALDITSEPALPGWETAEAAAHRFAEVVRDHLRTGADLGVCGHGLIFSAWINLHRAGGPPPTGLWQDLRFPDLWEVDLNRDGRWTSLVRAAVSGRQS